ncbi:hypothetical protein [Nostoc sp. TCL240-02]|uniref:hypothetical protein n=1 Tax=Nostoc sp. TCL240-02 TaxID=2572090 RepID=UPI001C2F0B46|nr:hypothetical protein [Nostoc sp. TCL240-02]
MAGIPPQLLNRLRQALLECEQFESDRDLRAIFTYEPLRPWHSSLPQAQSRTSRVDNLIAFLVNKHRSDTKENALVLFVRLLSELLDEVDERHQQLADLALELERAIISSTATKIASQNPRQPHQEPTILTMNLQQKQRLEQRQESLQAEWNLRSEKLQQLRQALVIESGTAIKFQLEKQIQEEEKQLKQLEDELNSLEQALHPVNESLPKTEDIDPPPANRRIQSNSPNFFAYDDAWVGRDSLIRELSERIRRHCRLLILVGITGIGKTALGERLAVEVADWFENDWSHYHQENFDDEQQTSDFASVAARWLEKWGELITPDDRKDPQRLLNRLITYLRENRYLVQMDSLENILQGNEDEGWSNFKDEWWLKFFDSYLKAESCESRFILTSQDLPGQIEEVGTRSQNFWYCQTLSGLEKSEQIALFEKTELDVSPNSTSRTYLERVGSAYEGHPLALKVIAGEIKNKPFNGNVSAYWNRYGNEVEEVEKAIAEAQAGQTLGINDQWKLDRFTRTLKRNVRKRLEQTFQRLKRDAKYAYVLLCEASVYRCAVPEDWWLSHLDYWDQTKDKQLASLDTLRDRFLIEEVVDDAQCLVRQHNLIRSISLEHLKLLDNDE